MTVERFKKIFVCKNYRLQQLGSERAFISAKKGGKFIQSLAIKVDSYLKCIYTNSLDFQRRTKLHKNPDRIFTKMLSNAV